jgi:hypothetical protein
MMTQGDFKDCRDKLKMRFDFRSNMFLKFPTVIFLAMQRLLEINQICECGSCRPVKKLTKKAKK